MVAPSCIVPKTIGATNGSVTPLKYEMLIFIHIAASIAIISKNGKLNDFSTINKIIKIHTIEEPLTLLKSVSLVVIRSFIRGPSPATMAFLS